MKRLFEPIQIGNLQLRNRLVFPPMTTGFEERGMITPRSISFYTTLARGGVGLIILGDCSIQPTITQVPVIYDDRFVPGLRSLTDAVHVEGARISAQLFHQEYDMAELTAVMQAEGREAGFKKLREDMLNFCNRISLEQIERIQELFVAAALRAQAAGFDMIQIHGDRLLGMFSSPVLNKRQDEYGGSLENRARFALEVVRKVRRAVPDLPLDYKLAVIRTDPPRGKGGPTLEEAQTLAPWLVEAGIDTFHVCQANHTALSETIPPAGYRPYGCFADMAEAVRRVVDVPVAAVGRIVTPEFAESLLEEGKADLISLGRALICDPEWPRKAQSGQPQAIRACIMCNRGCTDNLLKQRPIGCVLNAAVGRPEVEKIEPAVEPKRVVVVGGGPAGLEAARVAAECGHRVTLFEQSVTLGGQLKLAVVPPCKDEMQRALDYLIQAVHRPEITLHLGKKASAESIAALRPHAVLLATGAHPGPAAIASGPDPRLVHAWDVLNEQAKPGPRVVVAGGGAVGVETAAHLAQHGHQVTLVEMLDKVGADESTTVLPMLLAILNEHGGQVLTGHKLESLTKTGACLTMVASGETVEIACDTVVLATGGKPERSLAQSLEARGLQVTLIGDCAQDQPRFLGDAVYDGFEAARSI